MDITINKIKEGKISTISALVCNGNFVCFVLEDGHNYPKIYGETRIPAGEYEVVKRFSGKHYTLYKKKFGHGFSLSIPNVKGFEGIMIHIGNTVEDTLGCLLVGEDFSKVDGEYRLVKSTDAYKKFYSLCKAAFDSGEDISIRITR